MRRSRKDLLGIGLLGLCAAVVVGALIYLNLMQRDTVGADLCIDGQPIGHHYIFIIDQTDPVPQRNIDQLRLVFNKTLRVMGRNDRVSIFYMGDGISPYAKANHSICNPGRGEDANVFLENPGMIEDNFRRSFLKPLEKALSPEVMARQAPQSPILEFLQDITRVQELMPPTEQQTYYILSDLLAHSPLLNQYQEMPSFAQLKERPGMIFHQPNFRGADISLIYIHRPAFAQRQTTDHLRFWRDYFLNFGAGRVNLL